MGFSLLEEAKGEIRNANQKLFKKLHEELGDNLISSCKILLDNSEKQQAFISLLQKTM
jgi:hypothetical protein